MQAVSYRQRMPVLLLHAALLSTALLAHELTAAEPPQRTSSHTPDEPVAGLRSLRLSYKTSDDEPVERTGMVWYPAAEPMQQHNYGGQIGFVASDSKVLRGKHPLLLFSHGFWGSADQSIFLTEELARRGYIVAAVNHADSLRSKRGDRPVGWPNFADANSWTDENHFDRREDLVALLDDLVAQDRDKESWLFEHVDSDRVGVMGHSLGGYSALGLVGAWPNWKDDRVKAALLLSPYSLPFLTNGELASIETPIMLQGGTLDWGLTPFLPPVYRRLTSQKYYLVLKNETHFGWTNLIALGKTTTEAVERGNARLMVDYSAAFFDRHLRAMKRQLILEEKNAELYDYSHAKAKR